MFKLILSKLYSLHTGRWKLKYEEKQINRCVLWANEDNCGCCEIDLPNFIDNKSDEYYLPYFF